MKPKRITGEDFDVRGIADQARQFNVAAQRCLPPGLPNGAWDGPVSAGVVCAAFSVELWLKALHGAACPAEPVPSGHDLLKLFKSLPSPVQQQLTKGCSYSPERFDSSLALDAGVFESWRYAYEHSIGAQEPIEPLGADVQLLLEMARSADIVFALLYASNASRSPLPADNPLA